MYSNLSVVQGHHYTSIKNDIHKYVSIFRSTYMYPKKAMLPIYGVFAWQSHCFLSPNLSETLSCYYSSIIKYPKLPYPSFMWERWHFTSPDNWQLVIATLLFLWLDNIVNDGVKEDTTNTDSTSKKFHGIKRFPKNKSYAYNYNDSLGSVGYRLGDSALFLL